MKKAILIAMILLPMLFLLPSCAAGVSQEEYDKVTSDLAAAQAQIQSLQTDLTQAEAQIQSLQGDLTTASENPAEALAYAEFLDILMYPAWKEAGITPRFQFADDAEWVAELQNRATALGDTKVSNLFKEIEEGGEITVAKLTDHCLEVIEEALK
jgi:outer membrane murein-binding lipoprotein Lpp